MSMFKAGIKSIVKRTKPPPKRTTKRDMAKEARQIVDEAKRYNKKMSRQDYNKLKDMAAKEKALNKEKKAQALLKKGSFKKVTKELPLATNDNIITKNKLRVVSSSKKIKPKKFGGKVMGTGESLIASFYE
jgi:hypothetical protein